MSRIVEAFDRCRSEKRAAFIPYLCAGDPDLEMSLELVGALDRAGADIIELGVPFSDPIADGPVNQKAAMRALAAGTSLSAVLELVAQVRRDSETPIVLFSYFNPLHCRGLATFAEQAASSGVDGVLCVDLPPSEAQEEYVPVLQSQGLDTVFLLAPTSDRQRIAQVKEASSGFVYYVSRTGVTGTRDQLPADLLKEAKRLRRRLDLPLAVGFGISDPEQVRAVGRVTDGVVVGSALVRLVEENRADSNLPAIIEERARDLARALRKKKP